MVTVVSKIFLLPLWLLMHPTTLSNSGRLVVPPAESRDAPAFIYQLRRSTPLPGH